MSNWLEHTVQVAVDAPIETVWSLWSDLSQMPRWMAMIQSVEVRPDQPELSRWTLSTRGLTFHWQARLVKSIPLQLIQWESVTGLPNRGAIRFYDRGAAGSVVKLSLGYDVPKIVGQLVEGFVGPHVEATLQADLERFREYIDSSRQHPLPS